MDGHGSDHCRVGSGNPFGMSMLCCHPKQCPFWNSGICRRIGNRVGLAAPDPTWPDSRQQAAPKNFAKLVEEFRWRDFRLAHIEIYPVQSRVEGPAYWTGFVVLFGSWVARLPDSRRGTTKFFRDLRSMEVSGRHGGNRPCARPREQVRHGLKETFYKISVRETGLYRVSGQWLQSHGANFIGQSSRKLHLLGNGGHLLPRDFNRARDTLFVEDAIWVERWR